LGFLAGEGVNLGRRGTSSLFSPPLQPENNGSFRNYEWQFFDKIVISTPGIRTMIRLTFFIIAFFTFAGGVFAESQAVDAVALVSQSRNSFTKADAQPVRIWADKAKTTQGLQAAYFASGLASNRNINLKIFGPVGFQMDPLGKFNPPTKKNPADIYTVQWEGIAEVRSESRIILSTHGRSRFYVDVNLNGVFESAEEYENGWNTKEGVNFATSPKLPPGDYPILIHYQSRPESAKMSLMASPGPVPYKDFEGNQQFLHPWLGKRIALLTRDGHHDPRLMAEMVERLDAAYGFHTKILGREPGLHVVYNGLAVIAEVPSTCGYGCGMVAHTGIELAIPAFKEVLAEFKESRAIGSLPIYELGRNFWFYNDQFSCRGWKADTGAAFASSMQLLYYDQPDTIHAKDVENIHSLIRNALADYEKGLKTASAISARPIVGMILALQNEHGGEKFASRFWQAMSRQPKAKSPLDCMQNFARAASLAAQTNLTGPLNKRWNLQISKKTEAEIDKQLELTLVTP
jgi:hypothetical protein